MQKQIDDFLSTTAPTQLCTKCHIEKTFDQFPPCKETKSRRSSWCRSCHNLASHVARDRMRLLNKIKRIEDKTRISAVEALLRVINSDLGTSKQCSNCGVVKKLEEFYSTQKHVGEMIRTERDSICKECRKKQYKEKMQSQIYREHRRVVRLKYEKETFREKWARGTIYRHRKNGCEIKLTVRELSELAKNSMTCPLCGRQLLWRSNRLNSSSPSLDRKDNALVISKENCWIICLRCNSIKGTMNLKEFVDHCTNIVTRFNGNP